MREFRYIKFQIDAIHDGSIMQVGDIRFLDNEGNTYSFPNTISATSNIASASDNESPSMLFDGDASTKWCSAVFTNGAYVILDLGDGQSIDVDTYNQWCWYTANDTALNPNRNPKSFSLWGSVNGIDYTLLDKVDYLESLVASESLAYTGNIVRDSLDGYSILDYIESDGTQYIDTGFKPNNNTKVEIGILSSQSTGSNVWLFGAQTSWGKNGYAVSTYTAEFGNSTTTSGIILHDGVKHDVVFDKGVLASDGTTLWSATSTFQTEYNMAVFAINSSGEISGFIGRVYYCKIYDNGTLIRDYVPAKNSDGVCGLYDKVNDVFYASATDSGFTGVAMGSNGMPIGYTKCEYIESDGTNYIDTGFAPNQDTKIEMAASIFAFDSDQYLYGAKDTSSTKSYVCAFSDSAMVFGYASQFPSEAYIPNSGEKFYITQDKNIGYINGEAVTEATAATFQSPVSLYLCARNNEGTLSKLTKVRIYSCKIYDNGTLIRDYIPCQTDKGVYGLWDDVNKDFYPSSTSIGFTGKWAENKMLDVSLAEFRHRLMVGFVKGELDYSKWRGVFIEDVNGDLWNIDDWDGSVTFNSVAVINDVHSFGIAGYHSDKCDFSPSESAVDSYVLGTTYGRTAYSSVEDAYNDMDGEGNTQLILASQGAGSTYAAQRCNAYKFANGLSGYLMAAGEYKMIVDNITEINKAMSLVGGYQVNVNVTSDGITGMWTSTLVGYTTVPMYGYDDNLETLEVSCILSHATLADTYSHYYRLVGGTIEFRSNQQRIHPASVCDVSHSGSNYGTYIVFYLQNYAGCRPLCRLSKVNL